MKIPFKSHFIWPVYYVIETLRIKFRRMKFEEKYIENFILMYYCTDIQQKNIRRASIRKFLEEISSVEKIQKFVDNGKSFFLGVCGQYYSKRNKYIGNSGFYKNFNNRRICSVTHYISHGMIYLLYLHL